MDHTPDTVLADRRATAMRATPFRRFSGFLKQFRQEDLPEPERELFDLLFPAFQGTPDAGKAYEKAKNDPWVSLVEPFIQVLPGDARPRRFGGDSLPRSRYFALCHDAQGNDTQTLAHELRAYRDAASGIGMVEVVDLAAGCALSIGKVTVRLDPQPAFAVLVHEPDALPRELRVRAHQQLPGLKGGAMSLYRFRYRVTHRTFEQTIDLRHPEVREWFYRTFRVPAEACDADVFEAVNAGVTPTIAHSRFHFENGRAPAPESFWAMLPTLLNPDLGGGNPGDTGSTLVMIGHWMRQHDVAAFVFPSARCDTAAVFQDGALKHWQGWNLLDYEGAPLSLVPKADVTTFVASPWAWVSLPLGVRLHTAEEDSSLAGSFAVEHMVDYWARDYLGQLQSIELARKLHGDVTHGVTSPSRLFQIGALSMRWLRMAVQGRSAEEIDEVLSEMQGLAIPYRMYPITGRALELWSQLRQGTSGIGECLQAVSAVHGLLARMITERWPGQELEKLAQLGWDIELTLFHLAAVMRAGAAAGTLSFDASRFLAETESALTTGRLDEALKNRIRQFHQKAIDASRQGGPASACFGEGMELQRTIYEQL